jgi:hypothetical protein
MRKPKLETLDCELLKPRGALQSSILCINGDKVVHIFGDTNANWDVRSHNGGVWCFIGFLLFGITNCDVISLTVAKINQLLFDVAILTLMNAPLQPMQL